MISKDFKKSFQYFINKIENKQNFAFARYADGEMMILNNLSIKDGTQAYNIDRWKFENNQIFMNDLYASCMHTEKNYYYAISCACCDPQGNKYYKNLLKTENITFSNLFINSNYNDFIKFSNQLRRSVVLIANKNCIDSEYQFEVISKIPIPDDCVNWYEKNKDKILNNLINISKTYTDQLFLVSAGPLSEIIVDALYKSNPNNTYIDVGSSLDIYTHKKITRPYQTMNNEYSYRICIL